MTTSASRTAPAASANETPSAFADSGTMRVSIDELHVAARRAGRQPGNETPDGSATDHHDSIAKVEAGVPYAVQRRLQVGGEHCPLRRNINRHDVDRRGRHDVARLMRMQGEDDAARQVRRPAFDTADAGIAVLDRSGKLTLLKRRAHACPLALRHAATEHERLGAAADSAEQRLHDDLVLRWGSKAVAANLATARFDDPERARLVGHAPTFSCGTRAVTMTASSPHVNDQVSAAASARTSSFERDPDRRVVPRRHSSAGAGCRLLDDERRRLHQEMSAVFRRRSDRGRRPRQPPSSLSSLWRREFRHASARCASRQALPASSARRRRSYRLAGGRDRRRRGSARRCRWMAGAPGRDRPSSFGARFDMETDAAFILILSVLVWQHGKAGAWVLGMRPDALRCSSRLDGCCPGWRLRCDRRCAERASPSVSSSVSVQRSLPVVKRRSATSSRRITLAVLSGRLPLTSRGFGAARPGPVPVVGRGPALWTRRSDLRFLSGAGSR